MNLAFSLSVALLPLQGDDSGRGQLCDVPRSWHGVDTGKGMPVERET